MLVVTFVGVWTPLVMKASEAIYEARKTARHVTCLNNMRNLSGARVLTPNSPSPQPSPIKGGGGMARPSLRFDTFTAGRILARPFDHSTG